MNSASDFDDIATRPGPAESVRELLGSLRPACATCGCSLLSTDDGLRVCVASECSALDGLVCA